MQVTHDSTIYTVGFYFAFVVVFSLIKPTDHSFHWHWLALWFQAGNKAPTGTKKPSRICTKRMRQNNNNEKKKRTQQNNGNDRNILMWCDRYESLWQSQAWMQFFFRWCWFWAGNAGKIIYWSFARRITSQSTCESKFYYRQKLLCSLWWPKKMSASDKPSNSVVYECVCVLFRCFWLSRKRNSTTMLPISC